MSASTSSAAPEVAGALTNIGMILDSQRLYEEALAPLRAVVEAQEKEAARML